MGVPIVSCRGCRDPGVGFGDFSRFFMNFRREKCFFNLSGPISMRNFTGNPFLMVSERYGHAKLVKSRKNRKKIAKLDSQVTLLQNLSRTAPHPTVDIFSAINPPQSSKISWMGCTMSCDLIEKRQTEKEKALGETPRATQHSVEDL